MHANQSIHACIGHVFNERLQCTLPSESHTANSNNNNNNNDDDSDSQLANVDGRRNNCIYVWSPRKCCVRGDGDVATALYCWSSVRRLRLMKRACRQLSWTVPFLGDLIIVWRAHTISVLDNDHDHHRLFRLQISGFIPFEMPRREECAYTSECELSQHIWWGKCGFAIRFVNIWSTRCSQWSAIDMNVPCLLPSPSRFLQKWTATRFLTFW